MSLVVLWFAFIAYGFPPNGPPAELDFCGTGARDLTALLTGTYDLIKIHKVLTFRDVLLTREEPASPPSRIP